jgi:hypothetical protein
MRVIWTLMMVLVAAAIAANAAADEKGAKKDKPKTEAVKIGPATYEVPATWKRQRPASEMRVVQFGVPLEEGDEGKAEFIVFYFGGQGGGVEENLARWKGMFDNVKGEPKVEKIKASELQITSLDISGDYKDRPAPQIPEFTLRKNYRMFAAVVETPDDGPYFFRVVGPANTMKANADNWMNMLKTAKVK